MVDGWHWIVASVAAIALTILVLLWYDTLRERPGWSIARATKRAALAAIVIPVGFVASAEGFTGQPGVINGVSDLLADVFGEAGRHARSAVGVAELPLGSPVEVEAILQVR